MRALDQRKELFKICFNRLAVFERVLIHREQRSGVLYTDVQDTQLSSGNARCRDVGGKHVLSE